MKLYLCTSEHAIQRAEHLGYTEGKDTLVLAHDAVYASRRGEKIKVSASDITMRGLNSDEKGISDDELLQLILTHELVIIP